MRVLVSQSFTEFGTEFGTEFHRVSQSFKCILTGSVQARHDVFLTTKGTKILATNG